MVAPRKTSSENKRDGADAVRLGVIGASVTEVDMKVRRVQIATVVFIVAEASKFRAFSAVTHRTEEPF